MAYRWRYDAMVTAMDQANLEPIIIEDLVKFGEDRGFDRGFDKGRAQAYVDQFAWRLGRPLTDGERESVLGRLSTSGQARLNTILLMWTPNDLAAWLADPEAR
jgi:hypothetical protein